jgi:hypothetical protein
MRRKKGKQDSLVGIAKGYVLEGRGSSPDETRVIFLLHIVQIGSGAETPSYEMDTGGLSPGL